MVGEIVPVLTDEHRDGRIFVDGEGDLWSPTALPGVWMVTRQVPFCITSQPTTPHVKYGPYTVVLE